MIALKPVTLPSGRTQLIRRLVPKACPLPDVHSDELRLQIFTHRSFYARPTHIFEDMPDDPSPDNEMLEHLGDSVLSLVVTGLMRDIFPNLRVGPSTKIRALVVGNPTLASISVQYRLPERLRMHPAQAITLRASTNIQADLFESYVGGLYLDRGLEVVKSWLNPLFGPYLREAYRTHLQQQCKMVEWVYADSAGEGTMTTPIWVVRAMVEGECLGRGRGSTKKAAKNEAAKEGLSKMGINVSSQESLV
ncbi:Ribonuclease 3 [Grifola frondosa]|uniref:Ribonuclease 3 n=1 Tax=Grifola frondosa TaxID=5627 RepID=A0A1C7M0Q9_GRIFR|nr:Ribonuclease 3 [Grifola frondosa]